MKFRSLLVSAVLGVLGLFFLAGAYSVSEHELVILTQFGRPIGEPVRTTGLHFRIPLLHTVNRLDKRVMEWDGRAAEMATRDKLYVVVDTFGRWRISDPLQFFTRLRDERSALSRLDDIIGSEVRNTIARYELIEIVRTSKSRQPGVDPATNPDGSAGTPLPPIKLGRAALEAEVVGVSAPKLKDFGIELMDVRFMRINYNTRVSARVHERMISERQQIASRFRSEGEGEAAKVMGNKERELKRIESESYRQVQTVRGVADARASEIYARAYGADPAAPEFHQFLRTMETYRKILGKDTTLLLSTESDLFRYLKYIDPTNAVPARAKK